MLIGVELFGEEITLVGLGAILAGLGSTLTGFAALHTARKGGEKEDESPAQINTPGSE